ncbi:polysaccharide lyase family 7 protein [Kitasatospora sp. NPDC052896]|uniref:polysaccharide lyase family 7 protein n=1 Tax=Kitasatospora sp. NPDC052896 TaxID=3364061 RepID=UPI0037CAFF10
MRRGRVAGTGLAVLTCLVATACGTSTHRAQERAPLPSALPAGSGQSGGAGPSLPLPSGAPSAEPIDLSRWQLILPVDKNGEASGDDAAVVRPARPTAPWLTQQPDGSLRFWAPAGGATTGHSLHSRTELDSLTDFPVGQGQHVLSATLIVQQLPQQSQDITIGQVHGYGSTYSAAPFVLLSFNGSRLVLAVESKPKLQGSVGPSDGATTSSQTVLDGLAPGQPLAYTMTVDGARLTVDATLYTTTGAVQHSGSVSVALPPAWNGIPVTFDAGDYEQDDAASSHSGGGQVTFLRLNTT